MFFDFSIVLAFFNVIPNSHTVQLLFFTLLASFKRFGNALEAKCLSKRTLNNKTVIPRHGSSLSKSVSQ